MVDTPKIPCQARRGNILPFHAPIWYPKTASGNTYILLACCVITAAVSELPRTKETMTPFSKVRERANR
jgi:hypothetical protein